MENLKNKSVAKRGRPPKYKFEKEKKEILDKLYGILDVSPNNRRFYFDDLKGDVDKQNQILNLSEDIKIIFNVSKWPFYVKQDVKEPSLSLVKSVLKDMKVKTRNIINMDKEVAKEGIEILFANVYSDDEQDDSEDLEE